MPTLVPPRSSTGHDGWIFDAELGVHRGPVHPVLGVPEYCWGDRLVRPEQGRPGQVIWACLTSAHGRGGYVTNVRTALAFLGDATFTEAGCALWSERLDVDKLGAAIVAAHRRSGQVPAPEGSRVPLPPRSATPRRT